MTASSDGRKPAKAVSEATRARETFRFVANPTSTPLAAMSS